MIASNYQIVNLSPDEEQVTFTRKKRVVRVPKYRTVSLKGAYQTSDYSTNQSQDFLEAILGLSKKAQNCFMELHKAYDEDSGISFIFTKTKTATQRTAFSVGFKELEKAGLAKRVKKQHYMINPYYYFHSSSFAHCVATWEQLP